MMNLSWIGGPKEPEYEEKNRVSSFRGYLLKLRRSPNLLAPQWGKRWFSIEGRFLNWYRLESDISPSGMIALKYIRSISKIESPGIFTFAISCPDRNLVLRCSSMQEMNNWIRAFHIHADIARGGNGMSIVSDFNEEPLRFQGVGGGGKRSGKLRSSLTLEQELDLNLKKLDDLEKEVNTPTTDGRRKVLDDEESKPNETYNTTNTGRSKHYPKKAYTNQYNVNSSDMVSTAYPIDDVAANDVLGQMRDFGSSSHHEDEHRKQSSSSGGARKRNGASNSDVIVAHREDSTNSIEDIVMANTRVVASKRLQNGGGGSFSNGNGQNAPNNNLRSSGDNRNGEINLYSSSAQSLSNDRRDGRDDRECRDGRDDDRDGRGKNSRYTYEESGESDDQESERQHMDFEISRDGTGGARGGRGPDKKAPRKLQPTIGYCASEDSQDEDFHYAPQAQGNRRGSGSGSGSGNNSTNNSAGRVAGGSSGSRGSGSNKSDNNQYHQEDNGSNQRRMSANRTMSNSRSSPHVGEKSAGDSAKAAW